MNTDRPTDVSDMKEIILPLGEEQGFRVAFNLDEIQAENKRMERFVQEMTEQGELS